MQLYPALITDALQTVRYPGNGKNLVEAGMVEDDIRIDGDSVSFSLVSTSLPTPSSSRWPRLPKQLSTLTYLLKSK